MDPMIKLFMMMIIFGNFISKASSQNKDILKCLGNEEKSFHKMKKSGPIYELNQKLIAEIIQIPELQLKSDFFSLICLKSQESPSLNLLEYSVLRGEMIFSASKESTELQKSMSKSMTQDYLESSREILLSLISSIQTLSPTPHCLEENFPELKDFFVELKYLQEDYDLSKIFKGKEADIFKMIKHYPNIFKGCQKRLKKKLKSSSTEEPKKR